MKVGYAWLAKYDGVQAPEPSPFAEIRPVSRLEVIGDCLAVPASVAPDNDDVLTHVLFALKHEGINLTILAQALPLVPEPELRSAYDAAPGSQFLRKACYLWEYYTGQRVQRRSEGLRHNYVGLFNPERYYTSAGERNRRWRVVFNGIGSLRYCAVVRKTPILERFLYKNLLQQVQDFVQALPADLLTRTLAWAYLDETRSSYAIERELPGGDKANRFIDLLKQAHKPRDLTEDYLVSLQNATVSNVFVQAASFRHEQNYLSNGLRGALGVTYLPPAPQLARELMSELMAMANHAGGQNLHDDGGLDPIMLAAVVSFSFVFVHPFMDGNGRLSRFLFHQVLCQQGALDDGLLLPVSAVLKQDEAGYKAVLESWSAGTRPFWQVEWVDGERYHFDFQGHDALYRYWDATHCVEFMFVAVELALTTKLIQESDYLKQYDAIYQQIDKQFDVAAKDLASLVMHCMQQNGRISENRRKQFRYSVPPEVFDAIETAYQALK